MTNTPLELTALQARVLGVLVEKSLATPDYYPLTLNALVAGCNQKTSRNPVMELRETEVQEALDELRGPTLVIESYGASGRVMRYAHNLDKVLRIPTPAVALLAVLMLRGALTAAELRIHCERLYRFPDISALEAYLEEMAQRPGQALALRLPKQPGSREHRYAHLLCGTPSLDTPVAQAGAEDAGALQAQLARLDDEVAELRRLVEQLYRELGVARPAP